MSTGFKGKIAENLAADYLEDLGYFIRERNYRYQKAEIDIIAFDDPFLVFVEVKSRSGTRYGYPEQAINEKKLEMLEIGIRGYQQEVESSDPIRIDVVSILFSPLPQLTHFKDVSMD